MYRVFISIDQLTQNAGLFGTSPEVTSDCLVCETDAVFGTFTFSSTNAEYQLLTSHSQLLAYDYFFWVSRCLGELFTFSWTE